jgi:hypothetical protein
MWNRKKETKEKKRRNPEFREEDLEQGEVVNDSEFGRVVHVSSFHSIAPDGTHIYEF